MTEQEPRHVKIIKACALYIFPATIVLLATLIFILPTPVHSGTLEGYIRGLGQSAETNSTLVIYPRGGTVPYAQVKPDREGKYSVELPPGPYTLRLAEGSNATSSDVPKNISIVEKRTLRIDIGVRSE